MIAEDFFYLWSFPFERASRLVTPDVAPVRFEDRAWLAVAAVRFRSLSLGPMPLTWNASVAGLLLICDYRDRVGSVLRGNYFLRTVTDSRVIAIGARAIESGYGELGRITLDSTGALEAPTVRVRLGDPASSEGVSRIERLFAGNRSGLVRQGSRARYCALEKDHWKMSVRKLVQERFDWIEGLDPKPELGFDTSFNCGRWSRLHVVGSLGI
ncbi:MAG TPA: hypothetical protein VEP66_09310 [Myxococcales bacterium]|nr:hypothetical protein [Myxococcales bacterium]